MTAIFNNFSKIFTLKIKFFYDFLFKTHENLIYALKLIKKEEITECCNNDKQSYQNKQRIPSTCNGRERISLIVIEYESILV